MNLNYILELHNKHIEKLPVILHMHVNKCQINNIALIVFLLTFLPSFTQINLCNIDTFSILECIGNENLDS